MEKFEKLNKDLNINLKQFYDTILGLNDKLRSGEYDFTHKTSFLDLKNHAMIQYLNNLVYSLLLKLNGNKIEDETLALKMSELRCFLDKMAPIESKLKYEFEKMIKCVDGSGDANDPLNLKPNIDDFSNGNNGNDDEEDDEDENSDDDNKANKLYRPPKLAAVYNDIDESAKDKLNKNIERARRRAFDSSIMRDLHMQYSDAPEELVNNNIHIMETQNNEMKHRQEYEEDNFIRKPMSKTEMARVKRLQNGTSLSKLSSFEDARVILDEGINMEEFVKSKKSKGKGGKAAGKKGLKKNKKRKIRYT